MKIKNISAKNLKGATFSHELGGVTLFYGPNYTNKSSRVEALALAVLGYLPGVAATPKAIHSELASGQEMVVQAGETRRSWTLKAGTVKYDGPDKPLVPEELLDSSTYFGLSGPAQTRFLFERAALPERYTVEALTRTICANLKNIKVEKNTPATEAIIETLCHSVRVLSLADDQTPQDWLTSLIGDKDTAGSFRARLLGGRANVQRMQKTSQGLAQVAEAEQQPQDAEQRLDRARAALETEQGELARLLQVGKGVQVELSAAEAAAAGYVEPKEAEERLAAIDKERNEAAAVAPPCAPLMQYPRQATPAQDKRLDELTKEKERLWMLGNGTKPTASVEERMYDEAVARHGTVSSEHYMATSEVERLKKQLEKAQHETVCPTCKQSTEEIQKKLVKQLKTGLAKAEASLSEITKARDTAAEAVVGAERTRTEARQKVVRWEAHETLYRAASEAHLAVQKEVEKETAAAWQRDADAFAAAQAKLLALSNEQAGLVAKLAKVETARTAMKQAGVLKTNRENALTLYRQQELVVQTAKEKVAQADVAAKRLGAWRAEQAAKAKAAEERERAEVEVEVLKQACDMLAALQEELVSAAVGPLLAAANNLFEGILTYPLEYIDGVVAYRLPTGKAMQCKRPFCSGTQEMLGQCAVQVALAAKAGFKLVVLDELGRLDDRNKGMLLLRLCELEKRGEIDQAVLVDVREPTQQMPDNFKAIKVTA